ncbi:MAG: hypothetical protein JKY52_10745 [Flavobacteriales bacterium]|nr:hypothetical protein [Flavobacteriales bacterium]
MARYPPNEDYLLSFSTYSMYEISKSAKFYGQFKQLYSIFPCVVVMSYFPLAMKEIELVAGKCETVNPILLSPVGIRIKGKKLNPDSLDILMEMPEVKNGLSSVEEYTSEYFQEISELLDHPVFMSIKSTIRNNRNLFLRRFALYEMRVRFLFSEDREIEPLKLKKIKSLEMLAYCIYYKFFSDPNRKISVNDIVDALIMTTVPYVHTFISERNSIDILRKVKKQTSLINRVDLLTLSDIR